MNKLISGAMHQVSSAGSMYPKFTYLVIISLVFLGAELSAQCTQTITGNQLNERFNGNNFDWGPLAPLGSANCSDEWVLIDNNNGRFIRLRERECGADRTVLLNGPCFDLTRKRNVELVFDYRALNGTGLNDLVLEAQVSGTSSWTTLWNKGQGVLQDQFTAVPISLDAYIDQTVQLRFRADITAGDNSGSLQLDNLLYSAEDLPCRWITDNGDHIYYDCDNVGIGTRDPQVKLDVRGITSIGDTDSRNFLEIKSDVRPEIQFHTPTSAGDIKVGVAEADDTNTGAGEGDFYVQSADAADNMPLIVTKTGDVNLVNKDGRVGIGTTTPSEKLEVNGNTSLGSLSENTIVEIKSLNDPEIQFTTPTSNRDMRIGVASDADAATGVEVGDLYVASNTSASAPVIVSTSGDVSLVNQSGSLGVGTTAPTAKLDVRGITSIGDISSENYLQIKSSDSPEVRFSTPMSDEDMRIGVADETVAANGIAEGDLYISSQTSGSLPLIVGKDGNVYMVNQTGNVGIGTNDPGQYRLAVEGTIGARKVKVTTESWADYVFEEDYVLLPLSEVEAYIREHGHLPNVAPATQVVDEGIDLGDMNVKLMEKIEELTLYIIEQDKRLKALELKIKSK